MKGFWVAVNIISFANQKGGVGKTTSAINCASCLGALGKRVLLIDLDPQGSATSGVGLHKSALKYSSYDILVGKCDDIYKAIIKTEFKNLSVLPSNMSLAGAELELSRTERREFYLKNQLGKLKEDHAFDYIVIDCPPSLGVITINALSASNYVMIPAQCEFYALEGLTQLMMSIKAIRERYNPRLIIGGILITMYNPRLRLSSEVLSELKKYYEDLLFEAKISRSVALCEAPSYGEPINYYSKYSKGSLEYTKLAKEIITRIEG
ncbi:MAG: ParA family protein [Clostridia bacterium]|nr:ParA family protein [Clostridia bacterium]